MKYTKKKSVLYLIFIFTFIIGLTSIQLNSVKSLPFNYNNVGITFKGNQEVDRFTEIERQRVTFRVRKIQDTQEHNYTIYSDEGYESGDTPTEWGAMERTDGGSNILYYSKILKDAANITWSEINNREYSPHAKISNTSFRLKHEALNEETLGKGNGPSLDKDFEESTIGMLNIDVMPLLEADLTGVDNYNPYGSLHLELDNSENTASTLHLKFQTENTTGGQFLTAAYVYTLDESGNKSVMTKVFETVPNIFNWMNVKLFYDVYNDVYNVTIGQYAIDFGEDWLKTPVSTIIRGDQYNQETYELTNEKSIITELYSDVMKGRYCPTNLINSLDIWLETTKNTPLEESSEAYIDNLELRTWHFPAVYADTVLANKDISSYDPNGISFMNNSIISCYEPPKYPLENVDISLNTEYLLNAKNPSHMTPWLYAPSWVYAIPPVLTSDHDINVRSLMHIINNVEKPLEERGIYDPKAESMYGTEPEKRLNAQYFEYNESGSDVYKYRFDARYGSQYFQVELFDDLEREGMVKSIQLYNKSMNEDFLLFDFNYQYFGSFYGEEQEFIPGFPFEMILLIAGCSIFFLIRIGDKGKKSE